MCEFIENNAKCCKKNMYGNYCNKHKRNHLIQNEIISIHNFTNKYSDYLKGDILNTLNNISPKKYKNSSKKPLLFDILSNKYMKFTHYTNNCSSIIKIQKHYKKRYIKFHGFLRGEGFIDKSKCNNQEDFFTYETVNEIDDKYFFSYKDNKNIVWFFDIRSLKKILEMNQPNPYTMVPMDDIIKGRACKLIKYLNDKNIPLNFEDEMKEIKKDKKSILKQKIVDLSANIERLGFSFNIEWFTVLHTTNLKKLYSLLEDIWNYRAQLSLAMKMKICQPNGIVFNKSQLEIRNITSRDNIRTVILDDVLKFSNAVEDGDKKTGYMYFLIALAKINPVVYDIHPWILNID